MINAIQDFIVDNFDRLLNSKILLKLSFPDVHAAFSSDKLRARELKIFYAVHLWLTHDEARVKHAADLMKCVRFQLIEPENIEDLSGRIQYMTNDASCMRLLLDAQMYHMLPQKQPIFASNLNMKYGVKPRASEPMLVALGGKESTNQVSSSVQYRQLYKYLFLPPFIF